MKGPNVEPVSLSFHRGIRPLCPCCGGGEARKKYKYNKFASRKHSNKSRRSKPKYKTHRGL